MKSFDSGSSMGDFDMIISGSLDAEVYDQSCQRFGPEKEHSCFLQSVTGY